MFVVDPVSVAIFVATERTRMQELNFDEVCDNHLSKF